MRVPVILRVYTSPLVPVAGCGRFWAGLVALENNENSKGSFFDPLGFGTHLDLAPALAVLSLLPVTYYLLVLLATDFFAHNSSRLDPWVFQSDCWRALSSSTSSSLMTLFCGRRSRPNLSASASSTAPKVTVLLSHLRQRRSRELRRSSAEIGGRSRGGRRLSWDVPRDRALQGDRARSGEIAW